MHGLVNKAVECFVKDTHGPAMWRVVAEEAKLGLDRFEPMLMYDDDMTRRCLDVIAVQLGTPAEVVLEDIGTYLVSSRTTEALRRLLRFGGLTFTDFLFSLDDLPDRARLAMPDLDLPDLTVEQARDHVFEVTVGQGIADFGFVLIGMLRALADDYGALVVLDHHGHSDRGHHILVEIHEVAFAAGRSFNLADRRAWQ